MESLLGTSLEDPRTMAVMSAVQGLLGGRGALQGISNGLMAYGGTMQAAKQQEEAQKARAIQLQMQQLALQQAQEAKQKQAAIEQAYRGAMRTPQQMAMQANGGPTNAAAQAIPSMSPGVDQGALIQSLMQADPQAAYQMLQPKAPEYKTVGNSLVQVGPGGVKEAYRAPDKPEAAPSAVREFEYSLANPEFGVYQERMKRAGANNMTVDMRGDNEYAKDQGKQYSELMAGINKAGFAAPSQIRKLERMTQLLEGIDGGRLSPAGLEAASMLSSLGIKVDPRLGNKEAAQALSRDLAGGLRQPGTGPMTDKDFENFLTQIPDLSKTAEGRKQITRTMTAALNRDIKVSKLAREYERKHGRIDGGFMDEVAQFIADNPVVEAPVGWKVQR